MSRKSFYAVLAAMALLGSGISAEAEDYKGGDWNVEFTGTEMVSNFSSSDLTEAVYALQPGDSVTISLGLENKSGGSTEWYMTNKVLSSLEDSAAQARGGAYAYRLTYTEEGGGVSTLFESESIGGEGKISGAGLGLHEAAAGMEEYFRLDTLSPGEKGTVTLMVALDGETQGNAYQNTLADLRMNFAVDTLNPTSEDAGGPEDGDGGNGGSSESGGRSYSTGGAKTGDYSNLALWSGLAFVSGLVLFALAVLGMKKGGKEEKA